MTAAENPTKLFHGTTADAAREILKHGFQAERGGENWACSGEAVYFWSLQALKDCGEVEDDEDDYRARQMAFENAQFGLPWAKDCRAIVFEVDGEGLYVEPDTSCRNMSGAVQFIGDIPPSRITGAWITDDLSLLRGYLMSFHLDRDMIARELSPLEERIARCMQKAELYEEIEDLANWQKVSIPELKQILGL